MALPGAQAARTRRRWAVATATAGIVGLVALVAVPDVAGLPGWWWPATAATALLTGTVLASYVPAPGSGRRLEVGCTPCATAAGALAVFAVLFNLGRADAGGATITLALAAAAAYQRLNDTGTCPTSTQLRPAAQAADQPDAGRPSIPWQEDP